MKVFMLLALSGLIIGTAGAQQKIASVTVSTQPLGAKYRVDGQEYTRSATFLWPAGSSHTLQVEMPHQGFQQDHTGSTRYGFTGWTDSGGKLLAAGSAALTITADPSVTSYVANLTLEHRIRLVLSEGAPSSSVSPPSCEAPGNAPQNESRLGVVYVNGACFWGSTDIWLPPGPVTLNAFPYPGYVFLGWGGGATPVASFLSGFELRGGVTVTPIFAPGKRVRFATEPAGFRVLVDRGTVPTAETFPCPSNQALPPLPPPGTRPLCPGEFDWADGSRHVIGAPSPQIDPLNGNYWVFDSWAHGGGQNTVYAVSAVNIPETLTARFVRGANVGFLTSPAGLKLKVDGRDNWPSYNFVLGVGSRVEVSAPAEQVDSKGRRYFFRGWSNGGDATQQIEVTDAALAGGLRLTANYELLSRVTVQTSLGGPGIKVDGADCNAPCHVDRPDGATVRLSVPATLSLSESHRLEFVSWSDGEPLEHTITLSGAEARTLTAAYRNAYRLRTAADPADGARFRMDPASADGFYEAGAVVAVTADAQPGFRFRRWAGDLEGSSRTSHATVSAARHVIALLDRVPFVPEAGVRNAAGETPDTGVAPGSIISIYGANLAPHYEVGPSSPLAQTIADVTVRIGSRLLPLLFVSPEQINAQLPSDLEEGDYTLVIRWGAGPDVRTSFRVVRNAPGLFSHRVESKPFAAALHQDGSPVTLESPARREEIITLYGTGFGPYLRRPVDGFAVPVSPLYPLEDSVEVVAADTVLPATWSGAAAGYVGMDLLRFRVTAEMPAATVELKLRINGRQSNTVMLPVE